MYRALTGDEPPEFSGPPRRTEQAVISTFIVVPTLDDRQPMSHSNEGSQVIYYLLVLYLEASAVLWRREGGGAGSCDGVRLRVCKLSS